MELKTTILLQFPRPNSLKNIFIFCNIVEAFLLISLLDHHIGYKILAFLIMWIKYDTSPNTFEKMPTKTRFFFSGVLDLIPLENSSLAIPSENTDGDFYRISSKIRFILLIDIRL